MNCRSRLPISNTGHLREVGRLAGREYRHNRPRSPEALSAVAHGSTGAVLAVSATTKERRLPTPSRSPLP